MQARSRVWFCMLSVVFGLITGACNRASDTDTEDVAVDLTAAAQTSAPDTRLRTVVAARWRSFFTRICTKRDGSYNCACARWFNPDRVSCDTPPTGVDECATGADNCSAEATCTDTPAGFDCECNTGFEGDGVTCTMAAVNPCDGSANNCSPNATCASAGDAVTCTCKQGFSGDGVSCNDVDECAADNGGCSANATCANTEGGRVCTCNSGFVGDGISCATAPVDECTSGASNCSPNANCTDTEAGFSCVCKVGYTGNGVDCADVDECATSNGGCSANATCTNTAGGRSCACNAGYTGDGVSCNMLAVDECASGASNCSPNANCTDTAAGFSCVCKSGYTGDGIQCTDVDECATSNGGCSPNAACTNTAGGRSCACNPGFTGNGMSCVASAVDECATGASNCSPNATCTDTATSFTCACRSGYTGNGVQCTDVNECATNNGGCSANANCTNIAGSRTCACRTGFEGNGVTCTPLAVNECANGTDNCSPNATCTDTTAAFTCTCNTGFEGNGVTCTPSAPVCSLTGRFAVLSETDVSWDAVLFSGVTVIAAGRGTLRSLALYDMEQNGSTVSVDTQVCGETSPDICSPLLAQAYAQSIPDSTWQLPGAPRPSFTVTLSDGTEPGAPFVGELEARLFGLSLSNPSGPWPATYNDPAITWTDPDGDGSVGATSYMATTGTSASCGLPYAALPIPSSGNLATRVYTGQRQIAKLEASLVDCDTIEGTYTGPGSSALPQVDLHVGGCLKEDGSACTAAETESLDTSSSTVQNVLAVRVTMVRVPSSATCQQARAEFPSGS